MLDEGYYEKRRKIMADYLDDLAKMGCRFEQFDLRHRDVYLKYEPETEISCRSLLSQYAYAQEDHIYCMEDREENCLFLLFLNPQNLLCAYPPLLCEYSPERFSAAVEVFRGIFEKLNLPMRFEYVSTTETEWFRNLSRQTVIIDPPEEMDYIFEFEALRDFEGSHNSNRRRKYRYFLRHHQVTAEPICAENLKECSSVLTQWCILRQCGDCGYRCPKRISERVLAHLSELDGFGYLIRVDGCAQTVILLGRMSPDMLDVITFCSISRETGADETSYALVADEVLPAYTYMNLEEDMGIERLRRHKQSMHPSRMQPKYIVLFPQHE
ncbi:MAG: DUF2156 domain-containing protein [Clostridia bacterium]|nr:DUF2156 domain-containing protein [Clostridia bacterium]